MGLSKDSHYINLLAVMCIQEIIQERYFKKWKIRRIIQLVIRT